MFVLSNKSEKVEFRVNVLVIPINTSVKFKMYTEHNRSACISNAWGQQFLMCEMIQSEWAPLCLDVCVCLETTRLLNYSSQSSLSWAAHCVNLLQLKTKWSCSDLTLNGCCSVHVLAENVHGKKIRPFRMYGLFICCKILT